MRGIYVGWAASILLVTLAGCVGGTPPSPTRPPTITPTASPTLTPTRTLTLLEATGEVAAAVHSVVDGDTIDVEIGGYLYRVRYLGIDTPETKYSEECFGLEATERNRQLVAGQKVYLERDVSEYDAYGRLLRYVWLADGRMVNEVLVEEGYALAANYPPDIKHSDKFLQAQRKAVESVKGLWRDWVVSPITKLTPLSSSTPSATSVFGLAASPTTSAICDPSYPTVCIPPPPPDMDCKDIPYRNFYVRPPDPHRFDGDKDGIGCE